MVVGHHFQNPEIHLTATNLLPRTNFYNGGSKFAQLAQLPVSKRTPVPSRRASGFLTIKVTVGCPSHGHGLE